MLYATTRNNTDAYTSKYTLNQKRASDGGCYIPFHSSVFSPEHIMLLQSCSFNGCIAEVLNRLFGTKLTSWDVDFCIGRYPVRLQELVGRIVMGEVWHNPDWKFDAIIHRLAKLLGAESGSGWVEIAIRTAVWFAVYGEMIRQGKIQAGEEIDVSVVSGSFAGPISAWYASQWGLPIGVIICCCNENNELWNLICHGQFHTDMLSKATCVPEADVALPEELERLIFECGGIEEVEDYLECCRRGNSYFPGEQTLAKMRSSLYVNVVSSQRLQQTIPGAYGTHGYLLGPGSALAYAGLLDYRAKKGQRRYAVVLSEKSPVCDGKFTAETLGITEEKLRELM